MENIMSYVNYFTELFLDRSMLLSPSDTIAQLAATFNISETGTTIADVLVRCAANPDMVFSTVVWSLFGALTIGLLLIMPYKFVKRVIKKCRIC